MSVLIVFGSLLGKTRRLAVMCGMQLKEFGVEVKVKDVRETDINELEYFDVVILACSTWDDGQLQFDFKPFNSQISEKNYDGKFFAILALGGKKYPHYCAAAEILEETVKKAQGQLIIPTLKLDLDHDEPMEKCDDQVKEWTHQLMNQLEN